MLGIKLYKTYNKAKDFFKKPTLHWSFGKWKNNHCLPVWRRGPIIRIGKSPYILNSNCYEVKNHVQIFTGYSNWTDSSGKEHQSRCFDWAAAHKLPGNLKSGDIVWKRDIRKKLRKWHLSWIKPRYQLPIWLSFYIFNHDVGWKTKWGDTRYEWPPQFTIVFFGLAFSVWLKAPECNSEHAHDDNYWEGVIDYGFYKHKDDFDPVRFIKGQGIMHWTEYTPAEKEARVDIYNKYKDVNGYIPMGTSEEGKLMKEELEKYPGIEMATPCIKEAYIRKDKLEYFHKALNEVKEKNNKYTWIW